MPSPARLGCFLLASTASVLFLSACAGGGSAGDEHDGGGTTCSDGVDNDGDGKTDFPDDPGCTAPNQDGGEDDDCPSGPGCPACGNGVDDDNDGKIDFAGGDTGCASASDRDEVESDDACGAGTIVKPLPSSGLASGTLTGTSNLNTTCGGTTSIGSGGEVAYLITADRPMTLVATVDFPGTNFDSILYVRRACIDPTTEVACADDVGGSNTRSTLTASLSAGSYYLVVDAKTPAANAAFTLRANLYAGLGETCTGAQQCAPGHVCRMLTGATGLTCELPVCSDGRDDDSDGETDYPIDPGCTTPDDTTEDDTCPGSGCPACADGMDNDNDMRTDYPADPSCTSAASTSEADCPTETDALSAITAATSSGTTAGAGNQFAPTCASTSNAPDRVHMLYVRAPLATLTIDTNESTFDTVLMLKTTACGTTDIACNDNGGTPSTRSRIALTNVAPGSYAVVVDGKPTANGAYTLNVTGTYGNGMACDPTMPMFTCTVGYACTGAAGAETCQPAACNDTTDADGDGKNGYPTDPGCTSISDGDESDDCFPTPGPNCPACANGADDDTDMRTDYPMDLACTSAASTTERECVAETDPLEQITGPVTTGTTARQAAHDLTPSCSTGSTAPERVYMLDVPVMLTSLHVDTNGSAFDTVLHVQSPTCGMTLGCDDDGGDGTQSLVEISNVAPGAYAIVADGFSSSSGDFTLNVRGTAAAGSACTSPLFAAGVLACPTGQTCTAGTCQ